MEVRGGVIATCQQLQPQWGFFYSKAWPLTSIKPENSVKGSIEYQTSTLATQELQVPKQY